MPNTIIRVENLGKKYTIGHQQQGERYTALRDVIANGAKGIAGRFGSGKGKKQDSTSEDFWALKDVSFEIKQGDRVGIIGRNGAGKSTLLKILSRITEPTEGRVSIKGRVASLLEVGTGFHPELTGRENVYLNGAILGMGKSEIRRKFDEIVAFAEVERFLDTPVKRYSSGMYVRLAFAVAAHLDPEILVVDEVLAVGDAEFQKKCLGKMSDVSEKEGRTVLFVSHNISSVQRLCSRAILLNKGCVALDSNTSEVISEYMSGGDILETLGQFSKESSTNNKDLSISKCSLLDAEGDRASTLRFGEPFSVYLECKALVRHSNLSLSIGIDTAEQLRIATSISADENCFFSANSSSPLKAKVSFPDLQLTPGTYYLSLAIRRGKHFFDNARYAVKFKVSSLPFEDTLHNDARGIIRASSTWKNMSRNRENESAVSFNSY